MNKSDEKLQLDLAIYVLYKKMNSPFDLLKYWSIFGPCMEWHPEIEDIDS